MTSEANNDISTGLSSFGSAKKKVRVGQIFPRVGIPLFIAWFLEILSRSLYMMGYVGGTVRDLLGLAAFTLLVLSSLLLLYSLKGSVWLRVLVVTSMVLLLCAQISDVVDELAAVQHIAIFARRHPLHLFLEHSIFISGCALLMSTAYAALIDSELRRRELKRERGFLEKSIRERKHAEQELKEARSRLEQEVEARTAQLADRNLRLAVELTERQRFEDRLEEKLRFEEGLAACSRALVSGDKLAAMLPEALRYLAEASGTQRAYVYVVGDEVLGDLKQAALHSADGSPCLLDACENLQGLFSDAEPIVLSSVSERDILGRALHKAGAHAALLIPIYWQGQWRGVIGFESVGKDHLWNPHETRTLQTAAELIGACLERQRAQEELRSAHDQLEVRVAERTRDLTVANRMLSQEITDRNRLEKDKAHLQSKLRQAQKMQAIGTLAGGIAHDFNNILASILGYTELAIEKLPPGSPQRRYHDEVLKAAHRAKDLTHQILLFSRQGDQQKSAVYPHLVAQEVLALLDVSCPSNIRIERKIDLDAPAVLSDTVHMHQVLLNLCTNAQHAMKVMGGVLTITVQQREISAAQSTLDGELLPGEYVYIGVRDTGAGIDPVAQERIFDPFFTTKSVEEGTGMGLAIVHGIVNGQGGGIRFESTLGEGTLFEVFLPVYRGESVDTPVKMVNDLRGLEHVLVVDDEPQLVELWREVLEQYGYSVTGFDNSLRALEVFRAAPDQFNVVLLDQTMPGMAGTDVARSILAERPDMPVIIATGFSESVSPEIAQEIGLADLIYKPILGNDLANSIRRALDATYKTQVQVEVV